MTRSVRVLSSESWTKGVAVSHSNSDSLNVELATDRKVSWLPKHIFLVINQLLTERNVSKVEQLILFWSLSLVFLCFLGLLPCCFVCCCLLRLLLGSLFSKKSVLLFNGLDFFV